MEQKTGRQHACWLWAFVRISCFLASTRSPDGELQMSRSTETEAWRWGLTMLGGWTAPTPHRVRSPTRYILLCNICIKASYTLAFQQNSGISLHRFRISFSNFRKRFLCQKANKWFRGVLPREAWHIKMCGVELIGAFWIWWHKTLCSMFILCHTPCTQDLCLRQTCELIFFCCQISLITFVNDPCKSLMWEVECSVGQIF